MPEENEIGEEMHIPDSYSEKLDISQPKVNERLKNIRKGKSAERNIPAEKMHIDQSNISRRLENMQKLKSEEMHIPDSDLEKLDISQHKVSERLKNIRKLHLQKGDIPERTSSGKFFSVDKTWTDYYSDILSDKIELLRRRNNLTPIYCNKKINLDKIKILRRHENLDKIELSYRHDNLNFAHHSKMANLDTEDQPRGKIPE
jgi:hypothetical protein